MYGYLESNRLRRLGIVSMVECIDLENMKCGSSAAEWREDAAPLARLRSATVYEVYTPCSRVRDCADVGPCPRGTSTNATDYAGWMADASATGVDAWPVCAGRIRGWRNAGWVAADVLKNAPTDYPVFTRITR